MKTQPRTLVHVFLSIICDNGKFNFSEKVCFMTQLDTEIWVLKAHL